MSRAADHHEFGVWMTVITNSAGCVDATDDMLTRIAAVFTGLHRIGTV